MPQQASCEVESSGGSTHASISERKERHFVVIGQTRRKLWDVDKPTRRRNATKNEQRSDLVERPHLSERNETNKKD